MTSTYAVAQRRHIHIAAALRRWEPTLGEDEAAILAREIAAGRDWIARSGAPSRAEYERGWTPHVYTCRRSDIPGGGHVDTYRHISAIMG